MASDLEVCQEIFRGYSWTYYYSSQFFPSAARRHVYTLYAFFRTPDEYVDNPISNPALEMQKFREEHDAVWLNGYSDSPVLRAFYSTAQQFGIPKEWADSFLDAMTMDLTVSRYETFEDLRTYVYGSAEVVGMMMARVLGVPEEGLAAAQELGLAMQLTNFYRDVGEDLERGRIYIPLEDLERFKLREQDWHSGIEPHKFTELMRYEAHRNHEQYERAYAGFRYIPRQSRLAVALASSGYQRTLQYVLREPMSVWCRRVSYGRKDYPSILYRAWSAAYAY